MAGCTTIITKQGVMITANAPNISCSDGKTYFWSGTTPPMEQLPRGYFYARKESGAFPY